MKNCDIWHVFNDIHADMLPTLNRCTNFGNGFKCTVWNPNIQERENIKIV